MNENIGLEYDRLLGEGAYGKVFLVKQQDGQQFAVKEIDLRCCDEEGREQALREANLLSRLNHDSILCYIDSCVNDDCLYIITEYCGGGDLEEYWQLCAKSEHSLPESLVSEWIFELAGALKYLHEQKILHRDMKTKNIFLTTDLHTKLGDLGIAKVLDLNQTKADTFVGTPSYMSPELFLGKSYNHKTDIWGLGCCIYEVMTFRRAFKGKALWTIIREIKRGKVPELPEIYSLELRTLVQDMMSQEPEARPSAKEIVQNDLLLYHRGSAVKDIEHLPVPNEELSSTLKQKSSGNSSGNLSGSFKNMLQQRGKSQEDRYRNSIARVSEKINSIRSTHGNEDFNTFVYHGDSDNEDDELEAGETILDNSLLKQYTEQLDTFVYKGDSNDSDSDYDTGDSVVKNRNPPKEEDEKENEEEDPDRTLIRQYSNTLEEDEEEGHSEEHDDFNEKDDFPVVQLDSKLKTMSEETVNFDSFKYKYRGLKDTFQLKNTKVHRRRADEIFETKNRKSAVRTRSLNESDVKHKVKSADKSAKVNPLADASSKSADKSDRINSSTGASSKSRHAFSLSASFSGTRSLPMTGKNSKQQLSKTQFFDEASDSNNTVRTSKMKVCDKIAESAKTKAESGRPPRPKQAFVEKEQASDLSEYFDNPVDHAKGVMSHLRYNLSPYPQVPADRSDLDPRGEGSLENGQANKGKKKKQGFLKKQAEGLRRSSIDETFIHSKESDIVKEGGKNVTLFTRAQSVKFSKDDEEDDDDDDIIMTHKGSQVINGSFGQQRKEREEMEKLLGALKLDDSETLTNEHRIKVQTSLVKAIGIENLQHVLDIMSMINDEQEIKAHLMNRLGPKIYEDYQQHLEILRILEVRGVANR